MEKISIILLNYNSYKDTIACIQSILEKQINNKEFEYEIIVVDNNSTDNSIEELRKIEDIKLIELDNNGGFAIGNNVGIDYAINKGTDYVLLLNNDTVITDNSIGKMYNEMKKHKDVGIMSCRIMFYDNKDLINYCGGKISWLKGTAVIEKKGKKYIDKNEDFKYTKFMTGCCMLIKREVFNQVPKLPEEYFMYYEDVDFCVQVRKFGYKLGICLNSVIYHKESASSGGSKSPFAIEWNTRNRIIFIKKYKCYGILTAIIFYITRLLVIIKYKLNKQDELFNAVKQGIIKGREFIKNENEKERNC